jgi:CRISPR/Cas system CSM-associated protein Csm3 (group 7 of RAMP superfamily)
LTEVRYGLTATEIYNKLLITWKNHAPSKATVHRWYKEFKEGKRNSFEDVCQPGRPFFQKTIKNIEMINDLVKSNPRVSLKELEMNIGINRETQSNKFYMVN